MNSYDDYINAIDNLEEIEKAIITQPRYRRCCTITLEIAKTILKNIKINIDAKTKKSK